MDALFSEADTPEHKQRRSSLKAALIQSLPKPDGLKAVTAITTARGALLQLADYALWQFFCGSGGSGSFKLNMSNQMPVIYNIVLVVIQKVMRITEKEAATALSTCLKNTKNRSSARKYLERRWCLESNMAETAGDTDGEEGSGDETSTGSERQQDRRSVASSVEAYDSDNEGFQNHEN